MEKNDSGQTSSTIDGLMIEHQEQIERLLDLIVELDKSLSSNNTYVDVKRTVVRIMSEANDKIENAIIEQDLKTKGISTVAGQEKRSWSKKSKNEQIQPNDDGEHVSGIEYCDNKTATIKSGSTAHLALEQNYEAARGETDTHQTGDNTATASHDGMFDTTGSREANSSSTAQKLKSAHAERSISILSYILSPSEGSLNRALARHLENNIREMVSRVTQPPETPEINLKDIALLKNSTKESKFGIVK